MAGEKLNGDDPDRGHSLPLWRLRQDHPFLFWCYCPFVYVYQKIYRAFVVIFAPWPSMHDPIKSLLNEQDRELADRLTEKWTHAKLGELQYVGITVGGKTT